MCYRTTGEQVVQPKKPPEEPDDDVSAPIATLIVLYGITTLIGGRSPFRLITRLQVPRISKPQSQSTSTFPPSSFAKRRSEVAPGAGFNQRMSCTAASMECLAGMLRTEPLNKGCHAHSILETRSTPIDVMIVLR